MVGGIGAGSRSWPDLGKRHIGVSNSTIHNNCPSLRGQILCTLFFKPPQDHDTYYALPFLNFITNTTLYFPWVFHILQKPCSKI